MIRVSPSLKLHCEHRRNRNKVPYTEFAKDNVAVIFDDHEEEMKMHNMVRGIYELIASRNAYLNHNNGVEGIGMDSIVAKELMKDRIKKFL